MHGEFTQQSRLLDLLISVNTYKVMVTRIILQSKGLSGALRLSLEESSINY